MDKLCSSDSRTGSRVLAKWWLPCNRHEAIPESVHDKVRTREKKGPARREAGDGNIEVYAVLANLYLGLIAGSLTTLSVIPQILRVMKTRSAHDLSWRTLAMAISGIVLWIIYGSRTNSIPLLVWNVVAFTLQLSLVLVKGSADYKHFRDGLHVVPPTSSD